MQKGNIYVFTITKASIRVSRVALKKSE